MACYGLPEEKEEKEECLRRSYCSRCSGWVAPLCTCSRVDARPSSSDPPEGVGLHPQPSASSPLPDGPRGGAQYQPTMVGSLVEMQHFWHDNRGVRYLLTVVDVLSKYAWVRPLKRKTGAKVVQAFQSIVDEGRRPQTLQTDQGKEFHNATVQRWLQREIKIKI